MRGVGPTGRSRGVGQPGPNAAGVSYKGWTGTIGTRQVWLAVHSAIFRVHSPFPSQNFAKVARRGYTRSIPLFTLSNFAKLGRRAATIARSSPVDPISRSPRALLP